MAARFWWCLTRTPTSFLSAPPTLGLAPFTRKDPSAAQTRSSCVGLGGGMDGYLVPGPPVLSAGLSRVCNPCPDCGPRF